MNYSVLLDQIRQRNEVQTEPYVEIYRSSYSLWLKYTRLDSQREELRHQLALLEHESTELVNKGEVTHAVENFRKRLESLQSYHNVLSEGSAKVPFTNLSRTIYDQRKLISHQNDEMKLLKSELNNTIERNVDLDAELRKTQAQLRELQLQLPSPPSLSNKN